MPEFHQNRYARELDRLVTPGCHWLDVGAGTRLHGGWLTVTQQELADRAARLTGCDVVGGHLARNPYLHDWATGPAEAMPFPAESFDLVTANMVLEHLENPVAVFAEIRRVLAPGGRFLFLTPNRRHPIVALARRIPSSWRRLLARAVEGRAEEHVFRTFYRANTIHDVHRLAYRSGLVARHLETFASDPFLRRFPFLARLETAWVDRGGVDCQSNLLGVLARPRAALAAAG